MHQMKDVKPRSFFFWLHYYVDSTLTVSVRHKLKEKHKMFFFVSFIGAFVYRLHTHADEQKQEKKKPCKGREQHSHPFATIELFCRQSTTGWKIKTFTNSKHGSICIPQFSFLFRIGLRLWKFFFFSLDISVVSISPVFTTMNQCTWALLLLSPLYCCYCLE